MIGLFATTCPFPISGISPSETGEFCFRFRVLLFYATQMYSRGIEKVRKPSVYTGFRTFNIYSSSSIEKGLEVHRSYISVRNSSLLNCSFLIHEFTDDLNVILLSRVTISLCRGLSSIASDFANGLRLCVKKISSI